jgi:pimeloyl-ACP methyl ester carboxylesterase
MTAKTKTQTKTVVMIHGAWMVPASWDGFKARYEAAGYTVLTPAWPYLDGNPAALRKTINPAFGKMGLKQIVDHYEAIIRALSEKPLLVGHSFGGLIVQLLLDRGLGAAGVALDPGPIAGVIADPVSLGAALPPILRWNGWNTPFLITEEGFNDRFANTAPAGLQKTAYDKYVVPAPGRIFYQAASMIGNGVDVKRRTAPLLVTSAEFDRTVAPALARGTYNKQKASPARTDFHEFTGVSHALAFEPGWEKVADYTLAWAAEVL